MKENKQQLNSEYSVFKVNELKDKLRERALPLSGNKATLIQRLIDNDNEDEDGVDDTVLTNSDCENSEEDSEEDDEEESSEDEESKDDV